MILFILEVEQAEVKWAFRSVRVTDIGMGVKGKENHAESHGVGREVVYLLKGNEN